MKIVTHYDPPPIPIRDCDWTATTDNYDPGEPNGEGGYTGGSRIGHGKTEAEAIADLNEQLAE